MNNMQLSETQIKKFQSLYFDRFSIELSDDEAREKGLRLVSAIRHLHRPVIEDKAK